MIGARLIERVASTSLQEERGEPLLAIAHLLAVALEHVAKRQPALARHLHEQEVRNQRRFHADHRRHAATLVLLGADDAPERLLVALLGDDRPEVALEAFDVGAGALDERRATVLSESLRPWFVRN